MKMLFSFALFEPATPSANGVRPPCLQVLARGGAGGAPRGLVRLAAAASGLAALR